MGTLEQLEEEYADSDLLKDFDRQEAIALMELAFLVVMIDGEVTNEELMQLTKRVLTLTFADVEEAEAVLEEHGMATKERIDEMGEQGEDARPFIEERVDVFADEDHRKKALEVLGTLAYADGLDEDEQGLCHVIGEAFGLDDEEIDDLLVSGAVDLWELGSDNVR